MVISPLPYLTVILNPGYGLERKKKKYSLYNYVIISMQIFLSGISEKLIQLPVPHPIYLRLNIWNEV